MSSTASYQGDDVTVVIAAYNASSTLDAAIASVAAQRVPPGAIIVADDASTDDTVEVAKWWGGRLPVQVVPLDRNGGPAVARHAGIASARSSLIALLDADDFWLPDHLESMLAAFTARPGLITADALPWIPGSTLAMRPFSLEHALPAPSEQLVELIERNFVFMGTLFERDLYHEVGGFRSQFWGTEDWDLWIRMVRAGTIASRPGHPTVLYRVAPSGLAARDEQLVADMAVIDCAMGEATAPAERAALRSKARQLRAQAALFDAYRAGGEGRRTAARVASVRALSGQRRVALRAAAMLVAPRWGARQRDQRRYEPRWWFKRL